MRCVCVCVLCVLCVSVVATGAVLFSQCDGCDRVCVENRNGGWVRGDTKHSVVCRYLVLFVIFL